MGFVQLSQDGALQLGTVPGAVATVTVTVGGTTSGSATFYEGEPAGG